MSIDVVHIHGFKCAGTTIATLLAHNFGPSFRCVESTVRSQRLPWRRVVGHPELSGVKVVSSHTITPPPRGARPLVFGMVRNPSERLISAWKFFRRQSNQPDFPFSGYLYRQRYLKNYQSRLYSPQFGKLSGELPLWDQNYDHLQLSHQYFLGTVDRYTESLVVIQYLLNLRGFEFQPFVSTENAAMPSDNMALPDVPIPEDFIDVDCLLYRRCNGVINAFRELIPDFETRLNAIEQQAQVEFRFRHLVDSENFLQIPVSH